jgi:hypothetical protein
VLSALFVAAFLPLPQEKSTKALSAITVNFFIDSVVFDTSKVTKQKKYYSFKATQEKKSIFALLKRYRGREARLSSAKASTAVRICSVPPKQKNQRYYSVGFFI